MAKFQFKILNTKSEILNKSEFPKSQTASKGFYQKTGILLLALLLCFSGCDSGWQRYSDKEYKFSILLPNTWKKEERALKTVIMAFAPAEGQDTAFRTNMNVVVKEAPEGLDLVTIFELNKDEVTNKLAVSGSVLEGDIYAGFLAGKWLSFEGLLSGIALKMISATWIKGGYIYTITCASPAEDFPEYEPVFNKILHSLRV